MKQQQQQQQNMLATMDSVCKKRQIHQIFLTKRNMHHGNAILRCSHFKANQRLKKHTHIPPTTCNIVKVNDKQYNYSI